jgi:integrase
MAATEPIRDKKDFRRLAGYFSGKGQFRNQLLVILGAHTALRISDLLRLKWGDVYDFNRKRFYERIEVKEKKTGKFKRIALNTSALRALSQYLKTLSAIKPEGFVFTNNRKQPKAISRVQAWHIIKQAAAALKIAGRIACHSLRKTFGYHAWKKSVPVAVIMDIYNHSSFSITKRYLGISQDDRDAVYKKLSFGV